MAFIQEEKKSDEKGQSKIDVLDMWTWIIREPNEVAQCRV